MQSTDPAADAIQSSNTAVAKLKEENNHLVLQLAYERSLRQKYEEESNRLHIVKIGKLNFYCWQVSLVSWSPVIINYLILKKIVSCSRQIN